MLRQIKWWLQNEPIAKNGVLPVTTLFFGNFVLVKEPLSWLDVLATQMPIIVLFVNAGVLFDGTFSLWVSLKIVAKLLIWNNLNLFKPFKT